MGSDELNQYTLVAVGDMHDQAALVAANVEDDAIVADEIHAPERERVYRACSTARQASGRPARVIGGRGFGGVFGLGGFSTAALNQ